jgi:hypothetical protein
MLCNGLGLATVLILLFAPVAQADFGYHYAGFSQTASVARYNRAIMTLHKKPEPCVRGRCHVVSWVILWDLVHSGRWAEAGIGYNPSWKKSGNRVSLWWASEDHPYGVVVGTVPYGTPVEVKMEKWDGDEEIQVLWCWRDANGQEQQLFRQVPAPGWETGPGIHPAKIEVFTDARNPVAHPSVSMEMNGVAQFPEDNSVLQSSGPYIAWQHYPWVENLGQLGWFRVEHPGNK